MRDIDNKEIRSIESAQPNSNINSNDTTQELLWELINKFDGLNRNFEIMDWCSAGQSYLMQSWGEGASLALVGRPSSNGVTIKMPYGVDILHQPALHPIFSYWVA